MTDLARIQALREEISRRYGLAGKVPTMLAALSDKQRDFLADPAKRKVALCGRRAGKTTGVATLMAVKAMTTVIDPITIIPYITLSRAMAKSVMWPILKSLDRKYKLEMDFNNTDLSATLQNGSKLILMGAADEDDIEKLRGAAYPLAIIDECASLGAHLKALVQEVLGPALSDYDGTLLMVGSPSVVPAGPFHEASTGALAGWTVHRWTVQDNPKFPRWAGAPDWQSHFKAYLEEQIRLNGWKDENDPACRRELFGEWVSDESSLAYAYDDRHLSEGGNRITTDEWRALRRQYDFNFSLGVDFGYDDPTAESIVAWSEDLPNFYIVYAYKKSGMIPSEIAYDIKARLWPKYDFLRIIGDTGALGKGYAEEFRRMHQIPIEAAEKTRKFEFIELLNDDFRRKKAIVVDGQDDEECVGADVYIEEAKACRREKDERGRLRSDPRDNDHCFVAGTMVETAGGPKPIERVVAGDLVWTRQGLRRVTVATPTGDRPTLALSLASGRVLVGTAEHPIWTESGWERLSSLTPGTTITAWANTGKASRWYSEALRIDATRRHQTERSGSTTHRSSGSGCTGRFGNLSTALYRMATTFIMWTGSRSTTSRQTLPSSLPVSTPGSTFGAPNGLSRVAARWTTRGLPLPSGTNPRRGARGILSTLEQLLSPLLSERRLACASFAGASSSLSVPPPPFVATTATPSSGGSAVRMILTSFARSAGARSGATSTLAPATAPDRVRCVEPTGRVERVYNLSVEGVPEFFANGILVHNCLDSVLYTHRDAYHYLHVPTPPKPLPGTPDYHAATEKRIQEWVFAEVARKKRKGDDVEWED